MRSTNFKKAVSFFALASVFSMAGCQKDELLEETATAPAPAATSSKTVEGKYIVVMKNSSAASRQELRDRLLQRLGIRDRVNDMLEGSSNGFTGSLSKEEVQQLKQDDNVAYVEPEQTIMLGDAAASLSSETTTSTTISSQTIPWGVARVGYGDGTGKTVWVIDSGVQSSHPDLNVDKVRSKSFISGDASWEDGYGHGTGVAGIIGAKNNSVGVVGVAANATIVALRVFDNAGAGTLTRIYTALNYAYTNGKAGDVVNMSLRVAASTMLDDLVKKVAAKGMFVVVASGNSYIDCKNDSPARVVAPNVFVVSNMDSNGKFNATSNYGASVKYAAPGTNIKTTWKGSGYVNGNGTSYAAPHVAGILALTGGKVNSQGLVTSDPDGKPDPIALK
ncbi:S8 family serine peptidase [Rufibacter sp. H-1]|uniref:S8 family serine peptidase n=1 Tax=Rufibacter sediminis TaxID=2762756 RepID=A0ABR6VWH6_9BACT|nr:S8 family serine peptidase [Rufibacter sediminis]MBC3540966.1 S8 family serine peptidase [Rufibacter sediminis]